MNTKVGFAVPSLIATSNIKVETRDIICIYNDATRIKGKSSALKKADALY